MKRKLSNIIKHTNYKRLYLKYRSFTMIPYQGYRSNLVIAEKIAKVSGCIVECGVWKGGMIAGIAGILGNKRRYYLFDSFEGLPDAKAIDGESAIAWQKNVDSPTFYNNCRANKSDAVKAMNLSGVENFEVIPGWFNETLPKTCFEHPIALLRLDGDWYDSTMICLDNLFDKVSKNGLIVIDDYYTWDGCSRAVHDFLSKRSESCRIESFENVCFIQKR